MAAAKEDSGPSWLATPADFDDDVCDEDLPADGLAVLNAVRKARAVLDRDLPKQVCDAVTIELRILMGRVQAIRRGIFRPFAGRLPSSPEQAREMRAWRPPTKEQWKAHRKKDPKAIAEIEKDQRERTDGLILYLANEGLSPKEISRRMGGGWVSPWDQRPLTEKAINSRLFRLRKKGARQPVSSSAKNKQRPRTG